MNKKLIICLSSLIALMLIVIGAAVYRLYCDVPVEEGKSLPDVEAVDSVKVEARNPDGKQDGKQDGKPATNPKTAH